MTHRYRTNLRCESCVATIKPYLDRAPGVRRWSADVSGPDKILTLDGDDLSLDRVNSILGPAGYQALGELNDSPASAPGVSEPKTSYFPLLLILFYLVIVVGCIEARAGGFDSERAMRYFMAGFFLVFSFFKFLDLRAFADAYAGYDILARRSRAYALAYPFIELLLGLAYLTNVVPFATNLATVVVMGVSSVGVLESVVNRRRIRCACLGAVFNLPMSFVTLVEDLLMLGMALAMLFLTRH
jgi:hypothetical protein